MLGGSLKQQRREFATAAKYNVSAAADAIVPIDPREGSRVALAIHLDSRHSTHTVTNSRQVGNFALLKLGMELGTQMRMLAIETVDKTGSVAALVDGVLVAEIELDPTRRSAQTLVPGMETLLKQVGWHPRDVELIAVTTGPGSFTGLRIGVTTAKTFAYATGCQVLGVHSMLAIGWRVPADSTHFGVVIDAQRNELFVADLSRAGGKIVGEDSTRIVPGESWAKALDAGVTVTGPGLTKWADQLPPDVRIVDPALWRPTARSVGEVAWQRYSDGARDDVLQLRPQYFQRTAAEEQWDRKQLP